MCDVINIKRRAVIATGGGKWAKGENAIIAQQALLDKGGNPVAFYDVPADAVIDDEGRFKYRLGQDGHRLLQQAGMVP